MTRTTTLSAKTLPAPYRATPATPLWLRVLNWLADRDHAYRQRCKLREMPEERLRDMGMTRADAERAFGGR